MSCLKLPICTKAVSMKLNRKIMNASKVNTFTDLSNWWQNITFLKNVSGLVSGLPWWLRRLSVCLQCGRLQFNPWVRKIPWRRKWQSTPVLLPGKSHGQRSLVGYSPWCRKELDMTERLHFGETGLLVLVIYSSLLFQSPHIGWGHQTSTFFPISV